MKIRPLALQALLVLCLFGACNKDDRHDQSIQPVSWSGWNVLSTIAVVGTDDPVDTPLQRAAQELQTYLDRVSGRAWNVAQGDVGGPAIRLDVNGASARLAGSNDEAVHVRVDDTGIRITGKTPIAALHGAYILLHKMGVRWFFPHPAWEVVPEALADLSPSDEVHAPLFLERQYGMQAGHLVAVPSGGRDWGQWITRNRMVGPAHYSAQHSWGSIADKVELARDFPDAVCYYADGVTPKQLHPDHPEVIRRAQEFARTWLANPTRLHHTTRTQQANLSVPISPPDGNTIWCDEWRVNGLYSGQVITDKAFGLTNEVAKMLQQEVPGRYASVLSYSWYSRIPSYPLEPNVFVQVTTFQRYSGTNDGRALTLEERFDGFLQKGVLVGLYDYFDVWQYDWDEWYDPRPKLENLLLARRKGVRHFVAEVSDNWGPKGRLYWLGAQLCWDPAADPEVLLQDFYRRAFGPAKIPAERFYQHLDRLGEGPLGFGLAFRDLAEALEVSAGVPQVQERLRQLAHWAYFRARWQDQLQRETYAGISRADAEAAYRYVNRIGSERVVTLRPHRDQLESVLRGYGLTDADLTALRNTTPFSPEETRQLVDEGLTLFGSATLPEMAAAGIRDVPLVPLDRADLPRLAPGWGNWGGEVIVPSAGNETIDITARVTTVNGRFDLEWKAPDGATLATISRHYSEVGMNPVTWSVTTSAPGMYALRLAGDPSWYKVDLARPAALDVSPGWKIPGSSWSAYMVVPEGTPAFLIEVRSGSALTLALTDPTGATDSHSFALDESGRVTRTAPAPGVWVLRTTITPNAAGNVAGRRLDLLGVPPLLWHDPRFMLVPAAWAPVLRVVPGSLLIPGTARRGQGFPLTADVLNSGPVAGTFFLRVTLPEGTSHVSPAMTLLPGQSGPVSVDVAVPATAAVGTMPLDVEVIDDRGAAHDRIAGSVVVGEGP
ncbi:MAG: DUF4838 domain-containing protein [Planctomycetes bacterium]|nr:DUF4838 domain-containing protein [Planctomycetota bacterium]